MISRRIDLKKGYPQISQMVFVPRSPVEFGGWIMARSPCSGGTGVRSIIKDHPITLRTALINKWPGIETEAMAWEETRFNKLRKGGAKRWGDEMLINNIPQVINGLIKTSLWDALF